MPGADFEDLLAVAFQFDSSPVELTEHYDAGADLVIVRSGRKTSVQAKRWAGLVGPNVVEKAFKGMKVHGCDEALAVTDSIFSPEAREHAEHRRVTLWDHEDLQNLLRTTGAASCGPSIESPPTCPVCQMPMDYKTRSSGPFWGCANYVQTGCMEKEPYHKWDMRVVNPPAMEPMQPVSTAQGSVAWLDQVSKLDADTPVG
jgi:restriction system protein